MLKKTQRNVREFVLTKTGFIVILSEKISISLLKRSLF